MNEGKSSKAFSSFFTKFFMIFQCSTAISVGKILVKNEEKPNSAHHCSFLPLGPHSLKYLLYFEFQKPSHLPARDYITTLFEWIEHQIYDETLFPRDESVEFPKNFKKTCVKILGRMYRVFVHVYIHHFDRIKQLDHLNAEAHGNTLFKHFYYFVMEFQLLDEKELEPLEELIKKICI